MSGLYRPRLGASSARPTRLTGLRRLRLAACVLAVLLVLELVYIPFFSPRFAVRQIELRGDPEVAAQVAGKIVLRKNTNIFRAPVHLVRKQAESVPAVRAARVARSFLHTRMLVTLERREPMAVIRGAKEAVLVDPTGVVFSLQDEWGWGLPELTAPHLSKGDTGSAAAKSELRQLLTALRALGPDPRLRIARLVMDKSGRIDAALDSGARVRFGSSEQLPVKTKLLATVISKLGAEKIGFLDLSDPGAAYWRPKDEASTEEAAGPQVPAGAAKAERTTREARAR